MGRGKEKSFPTFSKEWKNSESLERTGALHPANSTTNPFLAVEVFFAFKQANIIPQQSHSFLSDLNQVLTTTMRTVQSPNITELKAELEQMRAAYLEEIRQDGFPQA